MVIAIIAGIAFSRQPPSGQTSGALASAPALSSKQAVDGIPCATTEQVAYHVHAHLAIFVNGQSRAVPEGIGIAAPRQVQTSSEGPFVSSGGCFYWLHTHTNDGIIHIESPSERTFTLGQFFDIWGQPLSSSEVGPANGEVIAYVNGVRVTGDPKSIALTDRELIQLDVGKDVPPQPFTFPQGL